MRRNTFIPQQNTGNAIAADFEFKFESLDYREIFSNEDDNQQDDGYVEVSQDLLTFTEEQEPGIWVSSTCSFSTQLPYVPRDGDLMSFFGIEIPVSKVVWDHDQEHFAIQMATKFIDNATYMVAKQRMEEEDWMIGEIYRVLFPPDEAHGNEARRNKKRSQRKREQTESRSIEG